MKLFLKITLCLTALLFTFSISAQEFTYKQPPVEILELMSAQPVPEVILSNNQKFGVVTQRKSSMSELSYIAGPEIRVAGLRIDPIFNTTRQVFINKVTILNIETGSISEIKGIPEDAKILNIKWSPTNRYICFTNNAKASVEIWRVNIATFNAEKLNTLPLNAVLGDPYMFLDDERILYKSVPSDAVTVPAAPTLPRGPVVQEHKGGSQSARTNPDMITSFYDEQLFEYYASAQLTIYSPSGNETIGKRALYRNISLSPNKSYLIVTTINKPYSYQRGFQSYPYLSEVIGLDGKQVKLLEENKTGNLSMRGDELPEFEYEYAQHEYSQQRDSSKTQLKKFRESGWSWRADKPQTLVWNESETPIHSGRGPGGQGTDIQPAVADSTSTKQDDTTKKEAPKQIVFVYQQEAPFKGEKQLVLKNEGKVEGILWNSDKFAVFTRTDTKAKQRISYTFIPCDTTVKPQAIIWQSTEQDTTGKFPVIGRPYMVNNTFGEKIIYTDDKNTYILLSDSRRKDEAGDNFWFIDKLTLRTKKSENIWSGKAPYIETIEAIIDFKNLKFISKKESAKDVPNYYIFDLKGKNAKQLTFFPDPYPSVQKMQRRFIEYKRADGVTLTANLYLPAGYNPANDGKLPVFMWGYPYEFKTKAEAEKRRAARYAFARPGYASPIFWATQGYAVLDDFAVPIIAEAKNKEPNDRFLKELIMDAEAAITYIDSIGVGDKNRVAVGGHSYGAFMTANLLAHTKLFKAGIARSGAYNRSLTPFGFQSEPRNYWKGQQLYNDMSPFNYADKIKTPILLIHGQIDNNQGTFPIQSERMFHALVGLGGTTRYVQLPFEAHRYSAKESILHVLYETNEWLNKYVKR